MLLAGGFVDGFVTGRPGNPRCNGQEIRCLFKLKGPEREVRIAETVIRVYMSQETCKFIIIEWHYIFYSATVNGKWKKLSA